MTHKESQQKYYEENKEKICAKRRAAYWKSRDKILAEYDPKKRKAYREANPDKVAKYNKRAREYYYENRDKIKAYNEEYFKEKFQSVSP